MATEKRQWVLVETTGGQRHIRLPALTEAQAQAFVERHVEQHEGIVALLAPLLELDEAHLV